MHKLAIVIGLNAALVAGSLASANPLSCRFKHMGGEATVTITAAAPMFHWQSPYNGSLTIDIAGLEIKPSFPVNLQQGDDSSKFEMEDGNLKSAKVMYNQGHQQVSIYTNNGQQRLYMEVPYGLFGGKTISEICIKD